MIYDPKILLPIGIRWRGDTGMGRVATVGGGRQVGDASKALLSYDTKSEPIR